ncbi:LrgB family protein [Atopococcus tabaci]|uniref:LrgB family protein n=1 Tax=Atopococcus tabaci TaxID=269774 RepID=UPI0003F5DF7B|nr:LrgB family protein [Atopococcus tabaci]
MIELLTSTPMFGIVASVGFYLLGVAFHRRWPIAIFTPLVFSIGVIIVLLLVFDIPYETYNEGGQFINLFVTPATVALAIRLEKNFDYLKNYYQSILLGIFFGVLAHTIVIVLLAWLFQFNQELFATLIPKSITTAIAVGVSESLGGLPSLTVAIVVLTGIVGAIVGPPLFKLFQITDPVAQGIAMGSSSHAMGTTKAIELGEVQGAMSGLAIVVTGIVVVIIVPVAMAAVNALFF